MSPRPSNTGRGTPEHMRAIGAIGGQATSARKAAACRTNASKPCAPGKGRGRPFHKPKAPH